MQKWSLELSVGLFLTAGIAALLVLAIKVSGLSDFTFNEKGYMVTADFDNVAGLKARSKVSIAGVAVGRVISITLDPVSYAARVEILFKREVQNIPEDSKASILTSGFLGDNYIGITPGFSEEYLKEKSHISLENTTSGVILEELISKFFSSTASNQSVNTPEKTQAVHPANNNHNAVVH